MINKKVILLCFSLCFAGTEYTAAETTYKVLEGDTFWKISNKFNTDLNSLISRNPHVKNADLIFPGDTIYIPNVNELEGEEILKTDEHTLFELTNKDRQQKGMKPLVMDSALSEAAKLKSIDMLRNEYVSHNSPTYGNPTIMLKEQRIPFQKVRENIGAGHSSADEMFSAWMNSSIHRQNLLDEKATHIGIGYAKGGLHGHYWTIFIVTRE